jgi:hypothetical protein
MKRLSDIHEDHLGRALLLLTLAWMTAVAAGCTPLVQEDRVSACGGFDSAANSQALTADEASYCDAEILRWRYEGALDKLTLTNTRVLLNCCGEHSMTVHQEGDTYIVTERDAPEQIGPLPGSGARCGCMCVFDYELAVQGVAGDSIALRLVREVTDSDAGVETVWEGELDLSEGQGGIVLDETDVEPWCSGELNQE